MTIIACRECTHHVSDQAESCPRCGAPIASNVKIRPRSRRSVAKVVVVMMALWTLGTLLWVLQPDWTRDELIAGARVTLQHLEHSNETVQTHGSQANTEPPSPMPLAVTPQPAVATQPAPVLRSVYRATAEELYRDYEANAVATQARIGTSMVRLNGSVAEIDQDAAGHPVVKLWAGKDGTAAMTLADNQRTAAAQLYKGEAVDIECDKIGGDTLLSGSDCTLAFVDIRTREVNLALFLTNDNGTAHVYVAGPMSEAVCRAHSEEISSRLRGNQRKEHLVWRSCTDAGRESVLPGGCRLNAAAVTLPDIPSARLWHYDCGVSSTARTASHATPTNLRFASVGGESDVGTAAAPAAPAPAEEVSVAHAPAASQGNIEPPRNSETPQM